jgi:hypothetical protein
VLGLQLLSAERGEISCCSCPLGCTLTKTSPKR